MSITDFVIVQLKNATEAELIDIVKNSVDVQDYGYHSDDDIALALESEFQQIAEELLKLKEVAIP